MVGRRSSVTHTPSLSATRHGIGATRNDSSRTPHRRPSLGAWCLLAGSLIGCGKDATGPVPTPRADASWFTLAIASQLDFAGRLPGTRPLAGQATGIDVDDAIRFSKAIIKDFGPALSDIFSDDAGIPVDGANLRQCDRVDFVESAYGLFAPERSNLNTRSHDVGQSQYRT